MLYKVFLFSYFITVNIDENWVVFKTAFKENEGAKSYTTIHTNAPLMSQ